MVLIVFGTNLQVLSSWNPRPLSNGFRRGSDGSPWNHLRRSLVLCFEPRSMRNHLAMYRREMHECVLYIWTYLHVESWSTGTHGSLNHEQQSFLSYDGAPGSNTVWKYDLHVHLFSRVLQYKNQVRPAGHFGKLKVCCHQPPSRHLGKEVTTRGLKSLGTWTCSLHLLHCFFKLAFLKSGAQSHEFPSSPITITWLLGSGSHMTSGIPQHMLHLWHGVGTQLQPRLGITNGSWHIGQQIGISTNETVVEWVFG
jgi:hypothetical protein